LPALPQRGGGKKAETQSGFAQAGVRVRVLGPNWSPWNNVMQEPGQYTRGSLPQCERSVKELLSFLPGGYYFRSWIPLRQRDQVRRDFLAKDNVYSLPLREWYFLSERESTQRDPCAIAS
jgi:hypothetical protein